MVPVYKLDLFFDPSMEMTDRVTQLFYQVEWINKSILKVDAKESFVKLQAPFDPTNTNGVPLATNEKFSWQEAGVSFVSDIRKLFNFSIEAGMEGIIMAIDLS